MSEMAVIGFGASVYMRSSVFFLSFYSLCSKFKSGRKKEKTNLVP